jgi:hypothetical protein
MNTEKINTLAQIHAAQDIIINALADPTLTPAEKEILQDTSLKLRNMERSIVTLFGQILVDSLTSDTADLKNLVEQIKQSAEKLAAVASSIEKVAGIVEAFISIISTATTYPGTDS